MHKYINEAMRHAKRVITIVVGFTVLIIGIAMIVLPGPAILVIPFGLSILAVEFVWAKKLLDRVKSETQKYKDIIKNSFK